jgi:Fe-S-cluster containining protein
MAANAASTQWQQLTEEVRAGQMFLDLGIGSWVGGYRAKGGTIHCGRGCSGCCTLSVNAVFTETLAIAPRLDDPRAERLDDHVRRLTRLPAAATDLIDFLRRHRREMGTCPFLDDEGACSIYPVRPYACRGLIATRDSRWCSADFASLPTAEKEAFVAGLDRGVVDFPMHYAAHPREIAREMESHAARRMSETFGFSLYGSLPLLVHLERAHGLAAAIAQGREETVALLERLGVMHPFLVTIADGDDSSATAP